MDRKAKVHFIDTRARGKSPLVNLDDMLRRAGFLDIDFKDKFVAIKIHFGEPGNLNYIRSNYILRVAGMIKEAGGKPFLTDCNTLYKGSRANAVDHLKAACENGFNRLTTYCDVIIADGLRGADFREIEIGGKHIAKAKIGAAIADADVIISFNHFKGHELTGFGGAIKNLGMGCGSVGGKLEMHSDAKPVIRRAACVGCGSCVEACPRGAATLDAEKKAVIEYSLCIGCGQCIAMCRYDAARPDWHAALLQEKIAEYAAAAVKGKSAFHVNFVMNITPDCDCWGLNDAALVTDVGILASFDPVAIDTASYDLANASARDPQGKASETAAGVDIFTAAHPGMDGRLGLAYAESIGLGSRDYVLERNEA